MSLLYQALPVADRQRQDVSGIFEPWQPATADTPDCQRHAPARALWPDAGRLVIVEFLIAVAGVRPLHRIPHGYRVKDCLGVLIHLQPSAVEVHLSLHLSAPGGRSSGHSPSP